MRCALSNHIVPLVAFALALYSLATRQYDSMRFYAVMGVLAVATADLAHIRRELAAIRGEQERTAKGAEA